MLMYPAQITSFIQCRKSNLTPIFFFLELEETYVQANIIDRAIRGTLNLLKALLEI